MLISKRTSKEEEKSQVTKEKIGKPHSTGVCEAGRTSGVRALLSRRQVRGHSGSFQLLLVQVVGLFLGCSSPPQGALYSVASSPYLVCRGNNRTFCLLCEIPSINWICGELAFQFFHFACQQQWQRPAIHALSPAYLTST